MILYFRQIGFGSFLLLIRKRSGSLALHGCHALVNGQIQLKLVLKKADLCVKLKYEK